MKNQRIASNIISGYTYHQNSHILDVTSNDGTVYQYFEVPEDVIKELNDAENPGFYYRKFIRENFKRLFKAWDYSVMF